MLIVDDLPANRLVLAQQLQFLGHRVVAFDSAESALQRWRDDAFDVLVTDCNMPGMSGYALSEAVRGIETQEQRPRTALVGCTANALEDEQQRCLASGMDELLVKPVTLEQWASVLARVAPFAHLQYPHLAGDDPGRWAGPAAHAGGVGEES